MLSLPPGAGPALEPLAKIWGSFAGFHVPTFLSYPTCYWLLKRGSLVILIGNSLLSVYEQRLSLWLELDQSKTQRCLRL